VHRTQTLNEVNAMKNNRFYGFLTATLLILAVPIPVHAGDSIQWLWSSTEARVNRSTEALAGMRSQRAVRLATAAMNAALPTDRLIARHNLCIAFLMTRRMVSAEPHCRAALQTPAPHPLARVRGALMLAPKESRAESMLGAVIKTNIAKAYGESMVKVFAAATP
jgi:hypothetical protein